LSAPEQVRSSQTATKTARPRLVFFYSNASGACRRGDGFLAQVLQRRGNHETFVIERIEETERPDLHGRFGIDLLPTLVVIEDKRVRGKLVGLTGCAPIERFLAPWLR
jgi:thioredoxin-like negative regulator of GroEL